MTRADDEKSARAQLGILLFLAGETMFFIGLAGAYLVLRSTEPDLFLHSMQSLNRAAAISSLAILAAGSGSAILANKAAQTASRSQLLTALAAIFLCLIGFLFLDLTPWTGRGVAPNIFFNSYFTLIWAHALHVAAALPVILILFIAALRGRLFPVHTRCLGIYWHFLLLIGLLQFCLIHLTTT